MAMALPKTKRALHFASPKKKGSGAPTGAKVERTAPVAGHSRDPLTGPLAFRRSTADCRDFRLDPARASASWNHRMQTGGPHSLSGASAVSTSQSGHAPDGHDAQAVRDRK